MAGFTFWASVGLVVYAYAGYPLAIALLARLRKRPTYPPAPLPTVTVIISAYNEEQVIAGKLDETLALDYPADHLQVVVATDGSDDATGAIVDEFRHRGVERSHDDRRRGKAAAINRAAQRAHHDIVVLSDANNHYESDALRHLTAPFADPRVGAVAGAKVIAGGPEGLGATEAGYWRYESFIKEQESRLGTCTGVAAEILAVRRTLLEPIPEHVINDDFWLTMRIARRGHRVAYAPAARSWEPTSASARDEVARRSRIVAGRYQAMALAPTLLTLRRPLVVWQVVSHKFARPLVPFAMVVALVANAVAVIRPSSRGSRVGSLRPPANAILLAGQAAFYAAAVVGGSREHRARWRLLYLPRYLVNSNWAALVGLYRFLRGTQTPLWERVSRTQPIPSKNLVARPEE